MTEDEERTLQVGDRLLSARLDRGEVTAIGAYDFTVLWEDGETTEHSRTEHPPEKIQYMGHKIPWEPWLRRKGRSR